MTKADEPSLRDQLLADYDRLEDAIEDAAMVEVWALSDWLAEYVPPRDPGPQADKYLGVPISLEDLAARGRRGVKRLQRLRRVAIATEVDRLPHISARAYEEALIHNGWDLMAANASLVVKGHRLRDQTPHPMESLDAIKANLAKRTPEQRAELARDLIADPTVAEIMDGEAIPDFAAQWADNLVLRVHTNAEALTGLISREGLRFAPSTPLREMYDYLVDVEHQIADVRAAVQERLRDAEAEQPGVK